MFIYRKLYPNIFLILITIIGFYFYNNQPISSTYRNSFVSPPTFNSKNNPSLFSLSDSNQVLSLLTKAEEGIKEGELENSLNLFKEAEKLSEEIGYKRGAITSNLGIGNIYKLQRNFSEALNFYLKAIQSAESYKDDFVLFEVYKETAELYQDWNVLEKAIENLEKAYQISKNLNTELETNTLQILALLYQKAGNSTKALESYNALAEIYRKQNRANLLASTLKKISDIHISQMSFQEALKLNTEILGIKRQLGNEEEVANYLNEIGFIYQKLNDNNASLKYFQEALNANRRLNKPELQNTPLILNIAVLNQRKGLFTQAITSYEEVLKIYKEAKGYSGMAKANAYLASTYEGLNDLQKAKQHTQNAIDNANKANDRVQLERNYKRLAKLHEKSGSSQKALNAYKNYLTLKEQLFEEEKRKQQQLTANQLDAEKQEKKLRLLVVDQELKNLELQNLQIESEKQEKDLALKGQQLELLQQQKALQEANLKTEQLEKQKVAQALQIAQDQLRAEQRQQEISELQSQQEIQNLALKQKELEKKERVKALELLETQNKVQELKLEEEKRLREEEEQLRIFGLGVIGLGFIILVLIVVGYLGKRRANIKLSQQNDEITQQKVEIEEQTEELRAANSEIESQRNELIIKNTRLTDSIRYAERIQNAILPSTIQLNDFFDEHFVVFHPKDVVSGDFYWYTKIKDKAFIAAVDCTGHGVPGAFMSMISNTLLNQIVKEQHIHEPNQILENLHYNIRESLRQRNSSNVDGLDICLCCIEKWEDGIISMKYSGAKCPLIFVQNGTIEVIKPDRKSIGGWQKEVDHKFTNHVVHLNKGDLVYLTTDGIIDIANSDRKRLGKKNLLQNLQDLLHLPLSEQKNTIEQLLVSYQKGADQRDDITFLGLKI